MTDEVTNLYDGHYSHLGAEAERAVRRATYDEDVGQSSWLTLAEAREFFRLLGLSPGRRALEVACRSRHGASPQPIARLHREQEGRGQGQPDHQRSDVVHGAIGGRRPGT